MNGRYLDAFSRAAGAPGVRRVWRCVAVLGALLYTTVGLDAHAQRTTRPPPKKGPKLNIALASDDERTKFVVLSDGDGVITWGADRAARSIMYLGVDSSRTLADRITGFARTGISTMCGATDPARGRPAPVLMRQRRQGSLRTFALSCDVVGAEKELVFFVTDTVVESPTAPPALVEAWTVKCASFLKFADTVNVSLSDSVNAPDVVGVACPKVYTAADIDQLASRLPGESGDSVAKVLAGIGPRVVKAVVDRGLTDIDPGARGRAARVLDAVVQQPFGDAVNPDDFVPVLARRWRDESFQGVADTIGRALGLLVERNPGRIRSVDTLVQVLKQRIPVLAERAASVSAVELERNPAAIQPLSRAFNLTAALREGAGPLVGTVAGLVGKSGSATDVLVAGLVLRLGSLAGAAGDPMRGLLLKPLGGKPGPLTVATYAEAQAVAVAAAKALAGTGALGRKDIDDLWAQHTGPMVVDTTNLPTTVPLDSAQRADSIAKFQAAFLARPAGDTVLPIIPRPPTDSAALRALREKEVVRRVWGTPQARAVLLEREIRRVALVGGFGVGCAADSAVSGPLALVADEPMKFILDAPADDESAQTVKNRLMAERERTRIAALDALGECGTRAMAQLPVLNRLVNTADDPTISDAVRAAALRALRKVRKIE